MSEGFAIGSALIALLLVSLLFLPSIKWPRGRKRGDPQKEAQRRKESLGAESVRKKGED